MSRTVLSHTARVAVVLALATLVSACGRRAPPPPAAPPTAAVTVDVEPERVWSAEEITQDPAGYLKWADARIGRQLADRTARLQRVDARRTELALKQRDFDANLSGIANLNRRLQQAIQRADDEDRWPAVVGGQSFDAARARTVIAQTARYVAERQPMADAYRQAVVRLDDARETLRRDIEQLRSLRERTALDLERVRVSQGLDELAALRRTEGEIATFAAALGQMADESLLATPPVAEESRRLDPDAFLRPP